MEDANKTPQGDDIANIENELRDSEKLIEKEEVKKEERQKEIVKSARQNVKLINKEMTNMDIELRQMIK